MNNFKSTLILFLFFFAFSATSIAQTWQKVAAGDGFSVAISSEGKLYAWGKNDKGQLGQTGIISTHIPTQIGTDNNWNQISCGLSHIIALKTDNTLWAWGNNADGQLGDGTTIDKVSPMQIGTGTYSSIACGWNQSYAIATDNKLWAWGDNASGQLGDGTTIDRSTPTQIGTKLWNIVTAGNLHTLAIDNSNTLWAWGDNAKGQLGTGTTANSSTPTQISNDPNWHTLAAGFNQSYALNYNAFDSLFVCGDYGSSNANRFTGIPTNSNGEIQKMACFNKTLLALDNDNFLFGLGSNQNGEFGNGTNTDVNVMTEIGANNSLGEEIACGFNHTANIYLYGNERICFSGNNSFGQCGSILFSSTSTYKCIPFYDKALILADKDESDAKVKITWNLPLRLPYLANNPAAYIQIREYATGKEIYSEIIDSIKNYDSITGKTLVYIKPDQRTVYELRVLEYGPGHVLMDEIADFGKTLPFQKPDLLGSAISPWEITLNVNSNSDYDQKLYVYRDDSLVTILDTSATSFADLCAPNIDGSIINGNSYTYKLLSINIDDKDSAPSNQVVTQNTYLVNFNAEDKSTNEKIKLTWNDLSAYVDNLIIKRDGITLIELNGQDQYFEDLTAVPGYEHIYGLELYDQEDKKITFTDTGSLLANGKLSGWVFNKAPNNFTIPNAKITATATVASELVTLTTVTDANGYYEFNEVAYYKQADFTISASLEDSTIKTEKSVQLNLENFIKTQDLILEAPNNELNAALHSVSNFTSTAIDSLGIVQLEWSIAGTDTVHYLLYRGEELIEIGYQTTSGQGLFDDLEGTPWVEYTYSIRTYDRKYNTVTQEFDFKFNNELKDTARNPQPFAISSFTATANASNATVDLAWDHPQGNIDGFRVFRNDIKIAELAKTELSYVDQTGANTESYTYSVHSYKTLIDGTNYNSSKVFSSPVTYPALNAPSQPIASNTASGFTKLDWTYSVTSGYNYTGFNVLRTYNGETIKLASIRKALAKLFVDESGVPNRNYQYAIQAYKSNIESVSLPSTAANHTYLDLPKVIVIAADGTSKEGLIAFTTALPATHPYLEIAIKNKSEDSIYTTYIGHKEAVQIPWNDYSAGTETFAFSAVKIIDGVKYYGSDTSQAEVIIAENGPYDLESVSDLTASKNSSSHVKLCWDFPNYYIPIFQIYRDGVWIDSVDGVQKTYFDHEVSDNELHLYQVQVELDTRKSKLQGAYGQKLSNNLVYGTVFKEQGKQGIESANVTLYLPDGSNNMQWTAETKTNVAGYYEFTNVSTLGLQDGVSKIRVDAHYTNASIEQSSQEVVYEATKNAYAIDFKDTLPNPVIPSDTITWVTYIVATPNANNQTVELRWQASNANYTSFEVYRGLVKIASVPASQSKLVIDNEGIAGYEYAYRIQPIWQKDRFTKIEGQMFRVSQIFPGLLPVEGLTAARLNDVVRINWNHTVNNNIEYEINRNNDLFAIVRANTRLEVIDSLGTTGQVYKYTVTPYLKNNPDIRAEEKSVTSVFPAVKQIKSITAVNLPNGVELTWRKPSDRTTHYKIYINGILSDTFESKFSGQVTYNSYQGIPGSSNTFAIAPGYKEQGKFYFGKKATVIIIQNGLDAVAGNANPYSGEDKLGLSFTYLKNGIGGFELFRDGQSITKQSYDLNNTTGMYELFDVAGTPQGSYVYEVKAYSLRNGIVYYSIGNNTPTSTFPKLSAPGSLKVEQIGGMYRKITWEHKREDVEIYVYSEHEEEGVLFLGKVDAGLNEFKDIRVLKDDYVRYIIEAKEPISGRISDRTLASSLTTLKGRSRIYTWGRNTDGQLGLGFNSDVFTPRNHATEDNWISMSGHEYHSLGIKEDGTLWAWGRNNYGQLGLGSTTNYNSPQQVGTDTTWLQVSAGEEFSIAVKKDGTLWAWGRNNYGQLGLGSTTNYNSPQQVGTEKNWKTISAGYHHMLVLNNSGALWGSGLNDYGQLGNSTNSNLSTLAQLTTLSFSKISTSKWNSAALTLSGKLYTWGRNYYSALGIGYSGNRNYPSVPNGVDNIVFTDVSCNFSNIQALHSDRRIFSAGFGYDNNFGASVSSEVRTFTHFAGSAYDITGGFTHSIVVGLDNAVYSAGYNQYGGELGKGAKFSKLSKYEIVSPAKVLFKKVKGRRLSHFGISYHNNPIDIGTLTAFEGISSKVKITWGALSTGKSINVYRDGKLISTENISAQDYTDLDAVPGKKHVYSVKVKLNTNELSTAVSVIGWRTPNGVVKGNVVSLIGNQPVPDVRLKLIVEAEEGNFYYETSSDTRGNFRFDDVYYGKIANVSVSASYLNHKFVKDTLLGQMDENVKSLGIGTFIDKTANLISGTISRLGGSCPMDSIPVVLIKHYNTKASVEETKYTISDGSYSYSVNPFEDDLKNFELQLPEKIAKGTDTIWYAWNKNNVEIDKSIVNTNTPKQNFLDTMGVTYKFRVQNSCTSFPNTEFTLNITSEDGCFERTIVSNDNGSFKEIQLPPLAYTVEVASAAPLTPNTIAVLDYLSVRPLSLDLTAFSTNSKGDSTFNRTHYIKEAMVYHNIPRITLTQKSGIENIPCEPDIYLIRKENSSVLVNFEVHETHSGTQCHVGEGFLVVKNSGAEDGDTILQFNETTARFGDYSFVPGLPATIAPYYKGLVVEYHTQTGYVSEAIYKLLIEGDAKQPGNDVIVTNEEGKDFQIPLGVLRDPPGDGSYSYIEKGVETSTSLSVTQELGGSFTASAEGQITFQGSGLEVKASAGTGGGTTDNKSFSISNTTTQRFETSAASDMQTADGSEYFVGDNADIIIGAGIALKYGIIESITFDDDSCRAIKSTSMGITTDKLRTTWVYTVADIKALIDEYKNALALEESGSLEITFAEDETPKDSSYFLTLIANWESVLAYHKLNTLPHYNLCDKGVLNNKFFSLTSIFDPIKNAELKKVKEAAESYQDDCFCNVARAESDGNLDSLNWNDNLINRYRFAQKRIAALHEYHRIYLSGLTPPLDYKKPSLDKFDESELNTFVATLTDADKAVAENITFSGNTSIEKSFTNTVSSSSAFSQSVFVNASLYAGIVYETKIALASFVGLGGGVITESTPTIDIEGEAGGEVSFEFNQTWETEESSTTEETSGYVLADDDAGDQFSVTIIKGLQNNHTPYFDLFAGRSSCPYEPGTLARDRPRLTLEYPDGTIVNNAQYDVNTEEPAYFPLKISNLAPEIFDEARYYTLIQGPNSNQFGAQVTADGSGQYFPLVFSAKSGGSSYTGLYVNKAGNGYDYPDITMQLIPTCLDESADLTDGFNGTALNVEAYFRKPCSNVSILNPTDNWRISRAIDSNGIAYQKLIVQIGDYDTENEFLEKISFEYRRVGTNEWIEDKGIEVYKDSLQRYFELYRSTYKDPVYPFIWDILNKPEVIDGEYELRAVVHCGIEGKVESNIVKGRVDRTTISLFGTPKPTDGVLNIGENVEVLFNEPIECGFETKANAHYAFYRKSDGLLLDFTPNCNNNSIIYTFDGDLDSLDKEVIAMQVFEVQDLNGNVLTDTINYEFIVSRSPVSWQPYTYEVDVYKGESATFNLSLVNTGATDATVNLTKSGTPTELLSIINTQYTLFEKSRDEVQFRLNAQTQNIGTYDFVVDADVSTSLKNYGIQSIPIKVNVLATPPVWVTPTGLSQSTVVICNFDIDSSTLTSVDTMDKIAITIDNEVRGFANIFKSRAGSNLYYAVVNVQGRSTDNGKEFEYRIWDASKGAEYDGKIRNGTIKFDGGIYGSTLSPRIIDVNTQQDSVRYIPLIKGWNWLAFNYKRSDMGVTSMLDGLNLTGGELIKNHQNKEAIYNDSTKTWFNTSTGLSTINTADGYLLFLNQDDVLRISGEDAKIPNPLLIRKGWNLIGNPYQSNKDINSVFEANAKLKDGAILKTGGVNSKAAVLEGGSWTGSISEYETNRAYMLKNEETAQLIYRSTDCDKVLAENFQYNATILGSVQFNWNELQVEGDYVIAEIDGVCRGRGYLEEVSTPSRRFMLNMFIYGDSADIGKSVKFKIYRQNTDELFDAYVKDSIIFTPDLHKGTPNSPYWFSNDPNFVSTKQLTKAEKTLSCLVFPNPFNNEFNVKLNTVEQGMAEVEMYDAFGRVVYTASHNCEAGINTFNLNPTKLSAGIYTVRITQNGKQNAVRLIKQ